ncbi:MAG: DNA-binding protein [Flavobacteriales bacterium]|nr:DNA-binding protein [Flavobacteriales bacterium]
MIKYKIIPRKNPSDRSLAAKFYVSPIHSGVVDLDRLSELISDGSTLREGDIHNVLLGMVIAISQQLADGRLVKLGKLGSFSISLNSEGAEKEEEAGAQLIKRAKIRYRPSARLKDLLKTLHFGKYKAK